MSETDRVKLANHSLVHRVADVWTIEADNHSVAAIVVNLERLHPLFLVGRRRGAASREMRVLDVVTKPRVTVETPFGRTW